jgi:hypothetical protein
MTVFKVQKYLAVFDRANGIEPGARIEGSLRAARERVPSIASEEFLYSENECKRCGLWSWRLVCECVFTEKVVAYAKLDREQRSQRSLPTEVLLRFTQPDWWLTDIAAEMEAGLDGQWVHHGNRTPLESGIHAKALEDYDFRSNGAFGSDIKFVEETLYLPAIDPYPGRDGLTTWQSIPLMLPVAAFFIDAVDDALRKKQWAARKPAWRPDEIYNHMDRKRQEFINQLEFLSKFFVELRLAESGQSSNPEDWAQSVGFRWKPLGPLPGLPAEEISPRDAEEYVERLVRYFGEAGSRVTRYSQDGGFDVSSDHLAVQVKHQTSPVGPQVVREIFGVAMAQGKRAAVFARGAFTKSAKVFADENQIILFQYFPTLEPHSAAASRVLQDGLLAELGL